MIKKKREVERTEEGRDERWKGEEEDREAETKKGDEEEGRIDE